MRRTLTATAFLTAMVIVGDSAAVRGQGSTELPPRNLDEFDRMFTELSNWGRWGSGDQLGTINLVTPAKIRQSGRRPREVRIAQSFALQMGPDLMSDTIHFNYHGYVTSHIDALCHFEYKGRLYNNTPTTTNTEKGCGKLGIEALKAGVITRGILIDIPRLRGVPYLEPGTAIYTRDIEAWEQKSGVRVTSGDAVLLYTGRWARRAAIGPWRLPGPVAGFHVSVGRWLKERDVAIVGGDAATDVTPARFDGLFEPLHHFIIAGLGAPILDALDLEAVAQTSAKLGRGSSCCRWRRFR